MAVNIGPKIGIDGEAQFRKELRGIIQQSKALSSEMKAVTSAFDTNDNSQKKLADQSKVLRKQLEVQEQQIKLLKQAVEKSTQEFTEADEKTQKWKRALNEAVAEMNTTKRALNNLEKETDDVSDSLDDAAKSGLSFSDIVKGNIVSQAIISGVKELASAFVQLGKQAVQNAADIKAEASQFSQTFGAMEKDATQAIQSVAKESGILPSRLKGAATQIYAFAKATGGDATTSMNIMERALRVSADSAAYYDRSLEETTETLQSFLKGNYENDAALGLSATETTRNAAAMKAFGKEFNELSEIQKQEVLLRMVEDAQKLSGALGQASREADGWENVIGNLKESWRQFSGNLGAKFLPAITEVVQKTSDLLSGSISFDKFIEEMVSKAPDLASGLVKMLTDALDGITKSLDVVVPTAFELVETLIDSMIKAVPSVTNLISEFVVQLADGISENAYGIASSAVDLVEELATGIISNLPYIAVAVVKAMYSVKLAIIKAIPNLITAALNIAGEYLSTAAEFIWPYLEPVLQSIGEFFSQWGAQIGEWWNNLWANFGQWLGNAWQSIYNTVTGWWNNVVSFFTESIPAWIASIGEWFEQLPYNIGYALGQAVGNIILFGQNVWNWITTELPKIITGIVDWFAQLPGRIWEWLLKTIENIKNWGTQTYNNMVEAAQKTINAVIDWFAKLPQRIWDFLTDTVNKVSSWGSDLTQTASNAAQNTFNSIIDWFQKLPGRIYDIGKNIVEGLWNGITSMGDWIWSKVTGFFGGLVDGIKNTLGIHSPSRVLRDEVGKMMPPGVVLGVESAMPKAIKQIDSMFSNLVGAVSQPRLPSADAAVNKNSTNYYGGINISVQAAPGMDINALVSEIERRLAANIEREEAIW